MKRSRWGNESKTKDIVAFGRKKEKDEEEAAEEEGQEEEEEEEEEEKEDENQTKFSIPLYPLLAINQLPVAIKVGHRKKISYCKQRTVVDIIPLLS